MGFKFKKPKPIKKIIARAKAATSSPGAFVKEVALTPLTATREGTVDTRNLLRTREGQAAATVVGAFFGPAGLAVSTAAIGAANAGVQQKQQGQTGGSTVGGNFLAGLGGALSGLSGAGGNVGLAASVGSSFLQGFLPARGPSSVQQTTFFPQQQVIPVMATTPLIRGAATAVAGFAAPLLAKMSASIGKNVTLRAAMIIIRRLGKFLQSPSAIGAAIGLSVSELSQLITAASLAGSHGRRMNVGNVKALRRAHRRIRSFHKLCGDNDTLKAPRRRRAAPKIINCK